MFASIAASAQTTVPAIINSNQVWTAAGNPYIVSQNTLIDTGVSVIVKPGVIIKGNTSIRIIIRGNFQALGTYDSMIKFNKMQLEFTDKAVDYNPATKQGAYLNYCWFDSLGVNAAAKALYIYQTDALIKNCKFTEFFYGVYVTGANLVQNVEVTDCKFINAGAPQGYALYTSGSKANIDAQRNYFRNTSLTIYGRINYIQNTAVDMYNCYFYMQGSSKIMCNTFKRVQYAAEINLSSYDTGITYDIIGNTFDSLGYTVSNYYPMVKISRNSTVYQLGNLRVNNNNFLNHNNPTNPTKVQIYGSNPNLNTSTLLDFKYNYWGTIDTTLIKNYIKDYTDDITIFGKANYSNFLSSEDTLCGPPITGGGSSCSAQFIPAIDSAQTSSNYTLYLIENSSGVDSNTTFVWTFPDTMIWGKTPKYYYNGFGKIKVCLTITNSTTNCSSNYCDSLGFDSLGSFLRINGFFVNVITWEDFKNLNTNSAKNRLNTKVTLYPNPAQEIVAVQLPIELMGNIHVEAYSISGKKQDIKTSFQANKVSVDCSNLTSGVYYLHIGNGSAVSKTRFVIVK